MPGAPDEWPTCNQCGRALEWQFCDAWDCDDGWVESDRTDDDRDYDDGESCDICHGKGGWWQCPRCGEEAKSV